MRRKDREITEKKEIFDIIKKCDVCRVAFFDEKFPYIVPLNFGATLEDDMITIYFHGANAGKKMELLEKNNAVAFEFDCSHKIVESEKACNYTMKYQSVCGTGYLEKLPQEQKLQAFIAIMKQYTDKRQLSFSPEALEATAVLKLTVNEITGKANS